MNRNVLRFLTVSLCSAVLISACGGIDSSDDIITEITRETTNRTETESAVEPEKKPSYAVSSSNDYVTQTGISVLEKGGNAVDAAIAMGYALAVVEPFSNGLGGSGGMVIYDAETGSSDFYDYRASSGAAFGDDDVGIPGFVAGMEAINEKWGTMSMESLIEPAVQYAENGFKVEHIFASQISSFDSIVTPRSEYHDKDGSLIGSGDIMIQSELADTLQLIQKEGKNVFYTGKIAADIADSSSLTMEDLAQYKVYERVPLSCNWRGYTVYSANAPLSGLTFLQMLVLSEKIDMADPAEDFETYLTQLEMITSAAETSRYNVVGDPAFTNKDCENYLTDSYLDNIIGETEVVKESVEKIETTSYSVVDGNGLAVSVTNTLSDIFGSGIFVDGFWLNNSNDNFSDSGINAFEPYKRSRTFTAPTIIVGDHGFLMSVGTPGGNKIPAVLFFVINDIIRSGEDYQTAVSKLRYLYSAGTFYVETLSDGSTAIDGFDTARPIVYMETGIPWGSVSLAGMSEDGPFAAFDFRRGATFAGVSK